MLRKSEALYDRLKKEYREDGVREFVICVRQKEEAGGAGEAGGGGQMVLADWLPVATILIVSEAESTEAVPMALRHLLREVAECVVKGAPSLRAVPRDRLQYAYEALDSFNDHVLDQPASELPAGESPYAILGLPSGAPHAEVRTAYRALAAAHHPDRHSDKEQAELQFRKVSDAYEQIKAGAGTDAAFHGSRYAAKGGSGREGLSEPLRMGAARLDEALPPGIKAAVRPIADDIVQRFQVEARPPAPKAAAVS